jgi:Cu+-exporting ATPase
MLLFISQKNCGTTVQGALQSVSGVEKADVVFADKRAYVWGSAEVGALIDAVECVGFGAEAASQQQAPLILEIEGMMCQKNCGTTVQGALQSVSGVEKADVVFADKRAYVWGSAEVGALIYAVECVGFGAEAAAATTAPAKKKKKKWTPPPPPKEVKLEIQAEEVSDSSRIAFFSVKGMSCASCVSAVEKGFRTVNGVNAVTVALLAQKAEVLFDSDVTSESEMVSTITGLGYNTAHLSTKDPNSVSNEFEALFQFTGALHSEQARRVQTLLRSHKNVKDVRVDVETGLVTVTTDAVVPRDLLETLQGNGYSVVLKPGGFDPDALWQARAEEIRTWRHLFFVSLVCTVPIFVIHMILSHIQVTRVVLMIKVGRALTLGQLILWILATPVQFYVGWRFYVGAWKGLMHGNMGMDFLVTVGTSCSYLYSLIALALQEMNPEFQGQIFFDSSAMLLMFVTFGKTLESIATGKTTEALTKLMQLQPKTAHLLDLGDAGNVLSERVIDLALVQPGDVLKVVPGGAVAADGEVVWGTSTVDESMITGESMPVAKNKGDKVIGATINQEGLLHIRASCVGQETTLSQIIELVQVAQTSKAPVQEFADKVSGIFAPVVLLLSLCTFIVWYSLTLSGVVPHEWLTAGTDEFLFSLLFSISVVVIACPCALGLATPTAVMVGTGVGASHGVLIKGGLALETAHNVTAIIFDKTGTLTCGKPMVTECEALVQDVPLDIMLRLAAVAESSSEHLLGKAIVQHAKMRLGLEKDGVFDSSGSFELNAFEATPGKGIKCNVGNYTVHIGNETFIGDVVPIPARILSRVEEYQSTGQTVVYLALDGRLAALFAIGDRPREEAATTVSELEKMGVEVWMVTGDHPTSAKAIAREVGISTVRSSMLPADKVEVIKELQLNGHVVAMIGDGINDAPALAQSDVGIAIGAGTEIAVAEADMVLIKSNLLDVLLALDLSRVVFRRIQLNFMWALGYNTVGIPVAAGVLFPILHVGLPPQCAGLAMAFSSVSVVISSLLLKRYKKPLACRQGPEDMKPTPWNCDCGLSAVWSNDTFTYDMVGGKPASRNSDAAIEMEALGGEADFDDEYADAEMPLSGGAPRARAMTLENRVSSCCIL